MPMKTAEVPRIGGMMGQVVVVFAATGAVGRGVADRFAAGGATVFLSGRRSDAVDAIAKTLASEHGISAHADVCDARDESAVASYLRSVKERAGRVDVVFNAIGDVPASLAYPKLTVELSAEEFLKPIDLVLASQFITAREAGRLMAEQEPVEGQRGAIITLSATLSGMTARNMAGITAQCGAVEAMTRALAGDFGAQGVRVNCVRASAMPETRTIQHTFEGQARILGDSAPGAPPPIGRMVTVKESAAAAVFLASAGATGITGQVLTVCGGQFVGQG